MFTFQHLITAPQIIHGRVTTIKGVSFTLSCIYASNDYDTRKNLWYIINNLTDSNIDQWILMGDFNYLLHTKEKQDGNPTLIARLIDFRDCIEHVGLLELHNTSLFFYLVQPTNFEPHSFQT